MHVHGDGKECSSLNTVITDYHITFGSITHSYQCLHAYFKSIACELALTKWQHWGAHISRHASFVRHKHLMNYQYEAIVAVDRFALWTCVRSPLVLHWSLLSYMHHVPIAVHVLHDWIQLERQAPQQHAACKAYTRKWGKQAEVCNVFPLDGYNQFFYDQFNNSCSSLGLLCSTDFFTMCNFNNRFTCRLNNKVNILIKPDTFDTKWFI